MHPQLESIVRQLEAARSHLHRLSQATPAERWSARNDPSRWSVAECVAHLNLTSEAFLPGIRGAIEEARARGAPAPGRYRMDPLGWLLSKMVGPSPRIGRYRLGRVKTSAAFVPAGDLPRERLVAEFERLQDEVISTVRAADGLAIDRVKVASPFDARAHYGAYAALAIIPRHQERHLVQAEEVWPG